VLVVMRRKGHDSWWLVTAEDASTRGEAAPIVLACARRGRSSGRFVVGGRSGGGQACGCGAGRSPSSCVPSCRTCWWSHRAGRTPVARRKGALNVPAAPAGGVIGRGARDPPPSPRSSVCATAWGISGQHDPPSLTRPLYIRGVPSARGSVSSSPFPGREGGRGGGRSPCFLLILID
jgi:hypothetical protein